MPNLPASWPVYTNFQTEFSSENLDDRNVSVTVYGYPDVQPSNNNYWVGDAGDELSEEFGISSTTATGKTITYTLTGPDSDLYNLAAGNGAFQIIRSMTDVSQIV